MAKGTREEREAKIFSIAVVTGEEARVGGSGTPNPNKIPKGKGKEKERAWTGGKGKEKGNPQEWHNHWSSRDAMTGP